MEFRQFSDPLTFYGTARIEEIFIIDALRMLHMVPSTNLLVDSVSNIFFVG